MKDCISYNIKEGKYYFQNHVLEIQPDFETFTIIDDSHAKDSNNVYNMMSIVSGADPESFELLKATLGDYLTRFSKDKQSVYFELNKIEAADPETFIVLDEFHGKDAGNIYLNNSVFTNKNVDFDSFTALGASFSKDKNHVYFYGNILDHADTASFMVFDPDYWGTFARDKKNIFNHSAQALPDVDVRTFKPLKGTLYGKDKNKVYRDIDILNLANPKLFTIINDYYTHDGNRIFCEDKEIKGADLASFEVLTKSHGYDFSRDKNNIYFGEEIFPILGSVNSFDPLNMAYCKDDTAAYYDGDVIEDVDIKSFTPLYSGFANDNNAVYFYGQRYADINPSSFKIYNDKLSVDDSYVYWMMEKQEFLDPDTLEIIGDHHIKDSKHVVYIDERFGEFELIEGADSSSFLCLENHFSKDNTHVYHCSEQLPFCDPDSFEIIDSSGVYSRDKVHVYTAAELIKDADRDTFECINNSFSKDKNHIYIDGHKVENSDPSSFHFIDLPYVENRPNYALMPEYAQDNNLVYLGEKIMKGADSQSFELISTWFSRDKNNIYSGSYTLDLIFDHTVLLSDLYIRDNIRVYFSEKLIKDADPESFEVISNSCHLAKDASHVYFREHILKDADSPSFYLINDSHCRDFHNNYTMIQGEWENSNGTRGF